MAITTCARITGSATGQIERVEYICHVEFEKADAAITKEWLQTVCNTDPEKQPGLVDNPNYARAAVWDFFRTRFARFQEDTKEMISRDKLPAKAPDYESGGLRLWFSRGRSERIRANSKDSSIAADDPTVDLINKLKTIAGVCDPEVLDSAAIALLDTFEQKAQAEWQSKLAGIEKQKFLFATAARRAATMMTYALFFAVGTQIQLDPSSVPNETKEWFYDLEKKTDWQKMWKELGLPAA